MKKIFTLAIALSTFFSLTIFSQQSPVSLEWVQHQNISDTLESIGFDIDADGCAIACGVTYNFNNGTAELTTVKYSSHGTLLWVSSILSSTGGISTNPKLKIGSGGNIYIGYDDLDSISFKQKIHVVKYDSLGHQQWITNYVNPNNKDEYFSDIALDAAENVYEAGNSGGNILVIKYDNNGILQWANNNIPGGSNALAVDNSGNVYTTGGVGTQQNGLNYLTVKYDQNGNDVWTSMFDGTAHFDDVAFGITLDNSSNVIVTGFSITNAQGNADIATVKYDNNGNQLWANSKGSSLNQQLPHITSDNNGNSIVSGSRISISNGNFEDIITIKYSPLGAEVWAVSESLDSSSNPNIIVYQNINVVNGIKTDASGNIYIAGYRSYQLSNQQTSQFYNSASFLVVKYSPNGNALWKQTYGAEDLGCNNSTFCQSLAYALAVPQKDVVYVTGSSYTGTNDNMTTVKYSTPQSSASPGSSCASAIDLGNKDTCANNQITSDNQLWLKFIPDSEQVGISVRDNNAQIGNDTLFIYYGDCNQNVFFTCIANHGNTSLFESAFDSIPFTPGKLYLLNLKTTLSNSSFSYCISNISNKFHVSTAGPCSSNNCVSVNCKASSCQIIPNGDFTNNHTPPSGQSPFYSCDVCCWNDAWGAAGIGTIVPLPPPASPDYAILRAGYGTCGSNPKAAVSDAIFSVLPNPVGNNASYILSYYDHVGYDQNGYPAPVSAFIGLGPIMTKGQGDPTHLQCVPQPLPSPNFEIVGPIKGNDNVNYTAWTKKVICFKTDNNSYGSLFLFPSQIVKLIHTWDIDDIELFPFDPSPQPTNPIICQGTSILLISSPCWQQLQALGVTASWTSSPAGFTSTSFNPTVSPQSKTDYTVTFTGPGGCTSSATITVQVLPFAIIFNTDNGVHCLDLSGGKVQFTSSVFGGILPFIYNWNFGDPASGSNNTSTMANPSHVYSSVSSGPGVYMVSLTVTDAKGCSTTVCHPVEIAPCCYQKSDFDVQQDISLTTQTWQQPPFNGYCNSC
ncbi:MAG: PKD domain-containing protein, partial [Bacteroidetes bacterium]|nr:PKD domain-containing protein [Bacteroidota bacterium]